jgi:hypothetical protein
MLLPLMGASLSGVAGPAGATALPEPLELFVIQLSLE